MWKDIDINFDKDINGDIKDQIDNEAIQNSLTNIWKTIQGSRRMLYPFAAPTWGLLFEQIDEITARNIGELLLQAIKDWEDRIQVENINVWPDPDNNQYVITLTYKVITEGDQTYIYNDVIVAV